MSQHIDISITKLSTKGHIPTYGSNSAAGCDLYSAENVIVPAEGKGLIKTDIAIIIPDGYYGRIAPRSGLAWKKHIDVGAGVIDSDYRGNIGIVLFNHSKKEFIIRPGDRIAQLILERIAHANFKEEDLDVTSRGSDGFGSTGTS